MKKLKETPEERYKRVSNGIKFRPSIVKDRRKKLVDNYMKRRSIEEQKEVI